MWVSTPDSCRARNVLSRNQLIPAGFLGLLPSLSHKRTTDRVTISAHHNLSVGPDLVIFPWIVTEAGGKSLDSTVRGCTIVLDCFGRRKSIAADRDTEAPVTCEVLMPLGETVSGQEAVSEAG